MFAGKERISVANFGMYVANFGTAIPNFGIHVSKFATENISGGRGNTDEGEKECYKAES